VISIDSRLILDTLGLPAGLDALLRWRITGA
jgi:hypothetical protein